MYEFRDNVEFVYQESIVEQEGLVSGNIETCAIVSNKLGAKYCIAWDDGWYVAGRISKKECARIKRRVMDAGNEIEAKNITAKEISMLNEFAADVFIFQVEMSENENARFDFMEELEAL